MRTGAEDFLRRLAGCLAKLPGVGRRSSERMALRLARDPGGLLGSLAEALEDVRRNIRCCSRCGNVTAVGEDPCRLCVDPGRDASILCVVEDPSDILTLERTGGFRGRYHALMGRISPMRGTGPDQLRIQALLQRLDEERFEEVILALNTDTEGDATASYLRDLLQAKPVKVTRLALGLPVGSGIAYADALTLERAIRGRQSPW